MAKIEIEESDLLAYRQVQGVVEQILTNPQARRLLQQARKITDPNVSIPELDAAAPILEEAARTREEIADLRKQMETMAAEREKAEQVSQFQAELNRQREALIASGYTEDGIAKVIEHARANGIGNLDIAAAHWEKLNPPPAPVESSNAFGTWNFFQEGGEEQEDTFVKKLLDSHGENESVVDTEARRALNEIRGASSRRTVR